MLREKKPIRSYHGERFRTNKTNKKHLALDCNHRCVYCDDIDIYGGGFREYQVEHFAPKSLFPELTYNYDNLLYACPWCNRAKWDKWPSTASDMNIVGNEGFVDPCSDDYDKHLKRNPSGEIEGITPLGKYMCENLNLHLKRHAIVYNVDRLRQKLKELEDSIGVDKKNGVDCSKKEAVLEAVRNDFFKYFSLWEKKHRNSHNTYSSNKRRTIRPYYLYYYVEIPQKWSAKNRIFRTKSEELEPLII